MPGQNKKMRIKKRDVDLSPLNSSALVQVTDQVWQWIDRIIINANFVMQMGPG